MESVFYMRNHEKGGVRYLANLYENEGVPLDEAEKRAVELNRAFNTMTVRTARSERRCRRIRDLIAVRISELSW